MSMNKCLIVPIFILDIPVIITNLKSNNLKKNSIGGAKKTTPTYNSNIRLLYKMFYLCVIDYIYIYYVSQLYSRELPTPLAAKILNLVLTYVVWYFAFLFARFLNISLT